MMTEEQGLKQLLEDYGYEDVEDLMRSSLTDSSNGGICLTCGYTTDVEPDNAEGWCEVCQDTTVVSGMVLIGL